MVSIEVIKSTCEWVERDFKRCAYSSESDFLRNYSNLSLGEISNRKITYSCFERSLILAHTFSMNNISVDLVSVRIKRLFKPAKIGSGLEFVTLGGTLVSGSSNNNFVYQFYPYKHSHSNVKKMRFSQDTSLTWANQFGFLNFEEFVKSFESINYANFLNSIKKTKLNKPESNIGFRVI